ncbi:MAG: DUF4192 domain-containing protein [Actinobacteria bacterium]|nr:DUF4192 domain-containing protein [Actinomycetota bacterium]
MTTQPTLEMHGPDHLVASLPYLLGFQPCESLVVVWTKGGRLLLTQRVDLPAEDDQVDLTEFANVLVRPLRDHDPDEVVLVVIEDVNDLPTASARAVGDSHGEQQVPSEPAALPRSELIDAVTSAVTEMDVFVRDALYISRGRFRSYLCVDECCPVSGRIVDPVIANSVAASFAVRGVSALPSRADLVSVLDADPIGVARIEPLIIDREQELDDALGSGGSAAVEAWRDEQVDHLASLICGGEDLSDADTVTVLVGLCDVRVRDTLLWYLNSANDRYGCLDRLLIALRLAPNGYVAPVATCAALVAWLLGDGARASIAIDRALSDDPEYSLAVLVGMSISVGLPPAAWKEVMGQLTVEACRARPLAKQEGPPAA